MTSQYICRVASVYEFCLVLSFWSEPQPLNYQLCSIYTYKPYISHNHQDHEFFIATIWRPWERNQIYWKYDFLYQEIYMYRKKWSKDFMFIGHMHSEGSFKTVLYKLSCEISRFALFGKTRVNILLLIAWVIHYLST